MDDSQDGVTVAFGVSDDPHGEQVVNLLKRQLLALHLLVNAVVMFGPSREPAFYVHPGKFRCHDFLDLSKVAIPGAFFAGKLCLDFLVGARVKV